jgi:cephalosporin hydroxylase
MKDYTNLHWRDEQQVRLLREFVYRMQRRVDTHSSRPGTLVEIGSFLGDSAGVFVECGMRPVVCVDPWVGHYDPTDDASTLDLNQVYAEFRRRLARHIGNGSIIPLRTSSQHAARMFTEQSVTYVYLDGCHTYDAVKADIALWRPLLVDGGIMSGHDYNMPSVKKAVDELYHNVRNHEKRDDTVLESDADGNWIMTVWRP